MRRWMICITPVFSLLAACPGEERPAVPTAKLAVATPCVAAGGRPAPVVPLRDTIAPDQWAARAPGAKAQAARAQAGRRMNYADALHAATSGCP